MLSKKRNITFILAIVSAIIGIMMTIQIQSNLHPIKRESRNITELRTTLQKELEKHKGLLADISKFNQLFYQYETSLNEGETISVMKEELARTRKLAGLVSVEGKGAIVRIVNANPDSAPPPVDEQPMNVDNQNSYFINDDDLRGLANSLFANGAKAVSLNGHRLISTTAIRNVGNAIQVDTRTIQPPFEFKALGEPDVLISGLKLEGVEEIFQLSNKKVIFEKEEKLIVPAYTEERTIQFMKPVKSKGEH